MEPTSISNTQTIHPNLVANSTLQFVYSTAAIKYIMFRRQRMVAAKQARDQNRQEWDDMSFLKWYEIMKKADDQYVAPRKNKQDTSINLGTIRDKDSTLLEYAMKYDFEPVAQCFDDNDDVLQELAETTEDMVKKSLIIEEDKEKQKLIALSMIAFGTALVEDFWMERWEIEKNFGTNADFSNDTMTWTEKKVKKTDGAQHKLWDLRKCFFGDISKFFMNGPQGQPFFFTVEYIPYDEAQSIYGNWARWNYVPQTVVTTGELLPSYSQGWTLRSMTLNTVEIVRYYDPITNEYALTLNGVDMLPIMEKKITVMGEEKTMISGFPLTAISPSGSIPYAKYDLEPMHDFAYSKSQPAKMRVLADVENMLIKLNLGMIKQKAKPTMGNKSGRTFGDEVTDPATIINDIRDGDLFPVLPNFQGPNDADFSMYEAVKKELDKNSVDRSFQGTNPSGTEKTAEQYMGEMKTQALKVAALFDGLISGRKQLFWLRTYNIITNWTKPVDFEIDSVNKVLKDKFRSISVATQVDGGKKANKKIIFTKDTASMGTTKEKRSRNVHQEELDKQEGTSSEIRIAYLNPIELAKIKVTWFYNCIPVPNDSDPLSYMMFAKQLQDAMGIFGPDSMNVKKLKHRFSAITGNDFDTWFVSQQELDQKQMMAQMQQQQGAQNPAQPTMSGAAKGNAPTQGMGAMMK